MNAIMGLIQWGEYMSWRLPKKCHLVMTANPSDGNYSTNIDFDPAQQSRFLTLKADFDVNIWAKWAQTTGISGTFINFALLTPEMFERGAHINSRSYTMFANSLLGFSSFDTEETLEKACILAKAAFNDDWVSGMFVQFVHNKLDKLIDPEQMLKGDWDKVKVLLEDNIYRNNGNYDASVASTLTIRFTNFIEDYFSTVSTDKKKSETVINRVLDLVTKIDKTLLTEDLLFRMIKTLNAKYPTRCQKLLQYPAIRSKLL